MLRIKSFLFAGNREAVEYNNTRVALDEAAHYLASHPDFWTTFGAQENGAKPLDGESIKPSKKTK